MTFTEKENNPMDINMYEAVPALAMKVASVVRIEKDINTLLTINGPQINTNDHGVHTAFSNFSKHLNNEYVNNVSRAFTSITK